MGDSLGLPVTAGLVTGVAFIVTIAIANFQPFFSGPFPDPSYYAPLIQLKITGLEESYRVGQRIDFAVSQRAAGCVFADSVIVKNLETGQIVWRFNGTKASETLFGCIRMNQDPSESRMTMNTRDEPQLVIRDPGSYSVIAEHQHVLVQQKFTVIPR